MTDVCMPGASDPLDDEQASREVAETNLAKELAERMERELQGGGEIKLPRSTTLGMIADAFKIYENKHPEPEALPCLVRDLFETMFCISLR